jgi:hypothetical protein
MGRVVAVVKEMGNNGKVKGAIEIGATIGENVKESRMINKRDGKVKA